jgi:hypothetical protein
MMILSIVLGLAAPNQLFIMNDYSFENPGTIIASDYFFIAPSYVVYLGWYGIRGLVFDALPAPFVWTVLGPGTLSVIQTLIGLSIAISIWRTGTGHGGKELIEATIALNLVFLAIFAVVSLLFLAMDGIIWQLFLPLFPGMAIVGCYYLAKLRRVGSQPQSV